MPNKIKEYRKKKNLLQAEVGEFIGMTDRAVGYYENGEREPKVTVAKKLAVILGTTIEDLFCL